MLNKHYNYAFKLGDLRYTKNGKPYFETNKKIGVSISHTKKQAVIVIGQGEVGCDIEYMSTNYIKEIVGRCFPAFEQTVINNSEDDIQSFYDIWTKKEACIKYKGYNLGKMLTPFNVYDEQVFANYSRFVIDNCMINVYSETEKIEEVYYLIN